MPFSITNLNYGTAIQKICTLVGHPVPADAAGSTDLAVQQMGAAVNVAMDELLNMHEWQDLTVKDSLLVVGDAPGQEEKGFNLPLDFYRFVDQSQWSAGSQLPAGGPVSNQAWMAYTVRNYAMQLSLYWQMRQDQLWFLNPPFPTPVLFEFMYLSKAQVIDQDSPTTFKNVANKNGDQFKLDGYVIMLLGRAKYLEWKGFDATAAIRDFLNAFSSRAGADKGAPVLTLGRIMGEPLINPLTSLPDTGYGS